MDNTELGTKVYSNKEELNLDYTSMDKHQGTIGIKCKHVIAIGKLTIGEHEGYTFNAENVTDYC